jgi:hypothetical protein
MLPAITTPAAIAQKTGLAKIDFPGGFSSTGTRGFTGGGSVLGGSASVDVFGADAFPTSKTASSRSSNACA